MFPLWLKINILEQTVKGFSLSLLRYVVNERILNSPFIQMTRIHSDVEFMKESFSDKDYFFKKKALVTFSLFLKITAPRTIV